VAKKRLRRACSNVVFSGNINNLCPLIAVLLKIG